MDSALHVMGCHPTQETRVRNACDDVVITIQLMDSALHVIGCHSTEETRDENACDEVAITIRTHE